jgi:hypothetical protein
MPSLNTRSIASSPANADQSFASWWEFRRTPILILAFLGAVFWTLLFLSYIVDDAFISFHYGKNLVLHHVWNWNASGTAKRPIPLWVGAISTWSSTLPSLILDFHHWAISTD